MNTTSSFRLSPLGGAAAALLICLGVGLGSQRMAATAQEAPAQPKAAMTVTVANPAQQALVQTLSATGGLAAWQEAVVGAEVERGRRLLVEPVVGPRDAVDATQQRLDDFARTRGYDGILSACTYATSPTPRFAAEGQYCVEARDATWAKLYEMLDEVLAGTRPMPSGYADVEPELPALAWPA